MHISQGIYTRGTYVCMYVFEGMDVFEGIHTQGIYACMYTFEGMILYLRHIYASMYNV